jgi:hypothetical protein
MRVLHYVWLAILAGAASSAVFADEPSSVDQAREALSKQEDAADSAKALEEVFQAAEKSYTLLRRR